MQCNSTANLNTTTATTTAATTATTSTTAATTATRTTSTSTSQSYQLELNCAALLPSQWPCLQISDEFASAKCASAFLTIYILIWTKAELVQCLAWLNQC